MDAVNEICFSMKSGRVVTFDADAFMRAMDVVLADAVPTSADKLMRATIRKLEPEKGE